MKAYAARTRIDDAAQPVRTAIGVDGVTAAAGGRRRSHRTQFADDDVDEALTLADRVLVIKNGGLADDLAISLPRPRTDDDLARSESLASKHILLRHLGLEGAGVDAPTEPVEA